MAIDACTNFGDSSSSVAGASVDFVMGFLGESRCDAVTAGMTCSNVAASSGGHNGEEREDWS